MTEKFYITTAIDYVNASPHIGHAYQKIVADALARWNRLLGKDVLFVTGTDEHGKKIQESAKKANKPVREFVDKVSQEFKEAWESLDVIPNRFIRTTDEDHKKVVGDFIKKCDEAGDIYKGTYEGFYCTGCEAYYNERDASQGNCPLHNRPLEKINEESYFFRLSKYKDFLLKLYETDFTLPKIRRNEVKARVEEDVKDLSITRTSFDWGIPFPSDKTHIIYVWFDALINYYTATREKGREDFWGESTVHLLGKDNTWFHNVYWPAMLKSAGIPLPKHTINHGFLTFNGQKISKSLGNAISPKTLVEKYGSDTVRYFCLRQFPFATGADGDFDESALIERHNNELANKYGNLVSRVSSLVQMHGLDSSAKPLKINIENIKELLENYEVDKALNEIFAFIDQLNEFIQDKKPWETKDKKVLHVALTGVRDVTILLSPFIPKTTKVISESLGFSLSLDEIDKPLSNVEVKKIPALFKKIEFKEEKRNLNKSEEPKEIMQGVTSIQYSDFEKLDVRVAKILNVEDIEGADKLYKLTIDIGEEKRTICAGIKSYYKEEDLQDKKIIVLVNLAPRKLKGILSQGMLLAASNSDKTKVSLLSPDQDMEVGSKVS